MDAALFREGVRKSFTCMFDELNGELISYAHIDDIFTPGASIRIERYTRSKPGEEDGAKKYYRRDL